MAIARLPLMDPTPWETEYLGGIAINLWTWSTLKRPSSIWQSRCWATGPKGLDKMLSELMLETLAPILGDEHHMIVALPLGVTSTADIFHLSLLSVNLNGLHAQETLS